MTNYSHPIVHLAALATVVAAVAFVRADSQATLETPHAPWLASSIHNAAGTEYPASPSFDEVSDEVIDTYCAGCHSDRRLRGNLSLEDFSLATAPDQGATAEKMIRKLRAGMMPPPGSRRPAGDSLSTLLHAL